MTPGDSRRQRVLSPHHVCSRRDEVAQPRPTSLLFIICLPCRYTVYPRRWFVLLTVTLLNLSTNALWMSYPAVANVSAEYFDKDLNSVDLFGTVGLYVGIPFCLISTFIYDFYGFRTGMLFGTFVNFLGGLVRCLSTFPQLNDPSHISLVSKITVQTLTLTLTLTHIFPAGHSVWSECVGPGPGGCGQLSGRQCAHHGQSELVPGV